MLKLTGTVHEVMPIEEIGSKGFAKRTLVIVDDPTAQYPSYAAFEAKRSQKKDRTLLLDQFRKGETVEVTFVPDARSWQDPKTGKTRWFGSLVLIDINRVGGAGGGETGGSDNKPTTTRGSGVWDNKPTTTRGGVGGIEQGSLDIDDMPF